jgi:hypothetical protein
MAQITARPRIELFVQFTINEEEARALDALTGYGDDAFIKAFYENLGAAYMKSHEEGLRMFLKSVRAFMPGILSSTDNARKAFK